MFTYDSDDDEKIVSFVWMMWTLTEFLRKIYFLLIQNGKIDHYCILPFKHMLLQLAGKLLCLIQFTYDVPATKDLHVEKQAENSRQDHYAKIMNGKLR